jgi:hypothetical protein
MATLKSLARHKQHDKEAEAAHGIDGVWYLANFLGDSFELTSFDDGALMVQMVRKRFRNRGSSVRLEPRSEGCWEAENDIRLCWTGKRLYLQNCRDGQWSTEIEAFQSGHMATGKYFRGFIKGSKAESTENCVLRRESSTVFKVEPFTVDAAFSRKAWDLEISELSGDEKIRRDSEDSDECKICMARESDVVIMPCGHSGVCETCLRRMVTEQKCDSCPFCRQKMEKIAWLGRAGPMTMLTDANSTPISELAHTPRQAWA